MRITAIEMALVPVTDQPAWAVLRLRTDSGLAGLGEVSDAGPAGTVRALLAELADGIVGRDPVGDRDRILRRLLDRRQRAFPARDRTLVATVMGGLDMALEDLAARAAGVPLATSLGGGHHRHVGLYANINRGVQARTPESFAAFAAKAVAAGFDKVKAAPFDGPVPDGHARLAYGLDILRAVRAAVGPDTGLMVDVHHMLEDAEVRAALPELERLGVRWLEDAVDLTRPNEVAKLAAATAIPLVGGEGCFDARELLATLRTGTLAVVMPDIKHAGGLRRALHIARVAARYGCAVSPHNPSGPVATAASLHLSSVIGRSGPLEYAYGAGEWRARVTLPPEQPVAAELPVPEGPGLGVALDPEHVHFTVVN